MTTDIKRGDGQRFAAEAIIVRELPDCTITFFDKAHIFVFPKTGFGTCFYRGFERRGSYSDNWSPFRRKLLRYKFLTLNRCHELAVKHDVIGRATSTKPDLTGLKIERRR